MVLFQNILDYFSLLPSNLKHFVFSNFTLEDIIELQTQNIYLVDSRLTCV